MAGEFPFEPVMDRLKEALGVRRDAELLPVLGLSSSNYANRKKAGSVPLEDVARVATEKDLDLNWILNGRVRAREPERPYAGVNAELLETVICAVDKELASRELTISTKKKAQVIAYLYEQFTDSGEVNTEGFSRFMSVVLER